MPIKTGKATNRDPGYPCSQPSRRLAEDKWGYKWARWVEEIELSDDETYRGYWEILGYSSDGSLDKPMFERYDKPESSGGKELR